MCESIHHAMQPPSPLGHSLSRGVPLTPLERCCCYMANKSWHVLTGNNLERECHELQHGRPNTTTVPLLCHTEGMVKRNLGIGMVNHWVYGFI